jgi:hypothetical protein
MFIPYLVVALRLLARGRTLSTMPARIPARIRRRR